jgi:hypothetical protein
MKAEVRNEEIMKKHYTAMKRSTNWENVIEEMQYKADRNAQCQSAIIMKLCENGQYWLVAKLAAKWRETGSMKSKWLKSWKYVSEEESWKH